MLELSSFVLLTVMWGGVILVGMLVGKFLLRPIPLWAGNAISLAAGALMWFVTGDLLTSGVFMGSMLIGLHWLGEGWKGDG